MLIWKKEKPLRSGWYWVTPDPKVKPYGVFHYDPNVFGLLSFLDKKDNGVWVAGPVPEPRNVKY